MKRVEERFEENYGLTLLWRWRLKPGEKFTSISRGDLNGDGFEEILAGSSEGKLYVFNPNGVKIWERDFESKVNSIWVSDVDGDDFLEIIAGGGNVIYILNADGEEKAQYAMEASITQIIALDSDRDNKMEIAAISEDGPLSLLKFR